MSRLLDMLRNEPAVVRGFITAVAGLIVARTISGVGVGALTASATAELATSTTASTPS